jgi:hypothetical protein
MMPPRDSAARRPERTYTVGATAFLVAVLGPASSWAHQAVSASAVLRASVTEWSGLPGDSDSNSDGLLLAALAAGIGLALRRPRRLAAGLVILLLVLAFEAGLHSVHHVGDADHAAACAVGVATAHLAGNPVEVVTIDPIAAPSLDTALPAPPAPVTLHRPAPHEGRAPPASTV